MFDHHANPDRPNRQSAIRDPDPEIDPLGLAELEADNGDFHLLFDDERPDAAAWILLRDDGVEDLDEWR